MSEFAEEVVSRTIPQMTVDAFVRSIAVNRNRPVCLLLGAGVSMSSGMPSAQRCMYSNSHGKWIVARHICQTRLKQRRHEPSSHL